MAKGKTQPPKGTRDFLPQDVRRRDHVVGVIQRVFEAHGFEPLQTPALERLDTLMGKYGEEGDQLLFKVLLRGQPLVNGVRAAREHLDAPGALMQGRSGETAPGAEPMLADLGLRYDLTVPLSRAYAAHQGKLPAILKRYQIQPVWRADTPGKGRFREFYQCDVDVVGASSRIVEAEVVGACAQSLRELGFSDFKLRINHRGLLRALIEHARIPPELEAAAITAIDKLDKVGLEGVAAELDRRGIASEAAQRLLSLLEGGSDLASLRTTLQQSEAGMAALDDLQQVLELGALTPAAEHLSFDITLARGLGYYTGCIFEVQVADLAGSLGGGGRYDGLVGMFLGKDVPACGFSLGLERILVVMAERSMYPDSLMGPQLLLAPVKESAAAATLRLGNLLRARGLRVDVRPKAMKPGKLRKEADERALPFCAWIEADAIDRASLWQKSDGQTTHDLSFDDVAARLAPEEQSG